MRTLGQLHERRLWWGIGTQDCGQEEHKMILPGACACDRSLHRDQFSKDFHHRSILDELRVRSVGQNIPRMVMEFEVEPTKELITLFSDGSAEITSGHAPRVDTRRATPARRAGRTAWISKD